MSHSSSLIATDIEAYLHQHENKDLLRLLTCGSVDDGKSTLIGRLLFDTKLIFEDHLTSLHKDNARVGNAGEALDLALLVDGLQSEREQGITIDVAYRYFSTEKRKFIIADCPGHEQYTRNMATGASNCELAIVMVDARKGLLTQTRRHSYIVSQLGIRHVVVAVNKMDLVDFDQTVFERIQADYQTMANQLGIHDVRYVPISALAGDNVVSNSENTPWYQGPSLMGVLEGVEITRDQNLDQMRFPVQYVNRPNLDFRGYCGTLASGILRKGDTVMALPSGQQSTVTSIVTYDGELDAVAPKNAITVTLADEIDISRGDMLVHPDTAPAVTDRLSANIVWMSQDTMKTQRDYDFKFASLNVTGRITEIAHKVDINNFETLPATELALNEIGKVELHLNALVATDNYTQNHKTGAFIVIDRLSNITVGAGMVDTVHAPHKQANKHSYTTAEIALNRYIREHYPEWDTLSIE
ncbi:sulfate adenylyltransferase subunit CysN [Grimontia hollisae]|uniref:Sulfate adenylyltransferase subunit 1 n=2 Tax=Grimontia hollisae TaxID=673 RepID=D0I559_GRIHO|nr:sulfate adenylyltransferase subunit CysN [Grimontia hollisae]AMG30316.1 sulfate adenylyltransferase subunit CysN [Grimontia hollisae]EEY73626.1 sulfate adenylate transferase subunit 1 [Grimontia hollisae CIP 101886]MDF2183424.1 sulfate adenylyltransferase subunit CysN [Grimontia hollisae]STO42213.1 Sulfate adenylyltransferase subunit 1 [Grimontia hollisae]STO56304.1 Sulfate adenylyltransferase subunit 1 [Grimontia hollisae]